MRGWIYALASLLPWPLNKGAKWLADRYFAIFQDGLRFARWIRDGMVFWIQRASNFVFAIRDVLGETYNTLKWIIVTRLPQIAKKVFEDATKWALARIDWVYNRAKELFQTLDRILTATINKLRDWAQKAVDWLIKQVDYLLFNVRKLLDRVFDAWSTPTKLARWLVGAMWRAFLEYLYQQRDKIAHWFLNSSAAFTMWFARQVESIIARLL